MNMQDVRAIARQPRIDASTRLQKEIRHKLRRQEGNFDCFATAYDGKCDQPGCMRREDCFEAARTLGLNGYAGYMTDYPEGKAPCLKPEN